MTFEFGKYRGYDIQEVPLDYLEWLLKINKEMIERCEAEIRRREMQEAADCSMLELIIKTGYRELSKRMHPDAGGTHGKMVDLNAAYEQLRSNYDPGFSQ